MSLRKTHPLLKIVNSTLVDLPSPANLSVHWNYGSLMGLILVLQIITGLVLAMRFSANDGLSFDALILICQDASYGWLLRLLHSTGASFFFFFIYLHIGRALYFGSYVNAPLWVVGVLIYFILMGTAFLGYVLPYGQMSYWAATVITNLLSAVPYLGSSLVGWVWGGFAVSNPTLTRFFSLHFLLPFVVLVLVLLHIFYLHASGSSNPLGVSSSVNNVSFHPYYSVNDLFYYFFFMFIFIIITLMFGYNLMDAENFTPANILVTPNHIQPEWYFLFAYAILRSIPSNLGGVLGLVCSILILFLFALKTSGLLFPSLRFTSLGRTLFWSLSSTFFILTWLGSCVAETPYVEVSFLATLFYFISFLLLLVHAHALSFFYKL